MEFIRQHWDAESWNNSSLLEKPIGLLLRTDVHVYSDSVLCVGSNNVIHNQTWTTKLLEIWDPMTFIDKYDITGRLVQFHFMPMFNDIEWLTKDKSNDVSLTEQRLPNTRSEPSWVVGVSVDQDKKNRVLLVLEQTERSLVSNPHENDTEVWRSSASDILLCRTSLEKRLQVQEGQAETIILF